MKPSSVPSDRQGILSSDQQFTHFNPLSICYSIGTEQPFPEFAVDLEAGSGRSCPTECNQSNGNITQENQLSSAANSTPLGCDPRAMLSNLSFLEQKIHQVQDIVRSIMHSEGDISSQPNKLAAQQQLVTADLTSIIIQLISTAGTLLPSINGTLLSTNPSVGQLGSIIGCPTSLVGLHGNLEQGEGIISEGTKGSTCEDLIEGMASYITETPDPMLVEEHDGKDEDGGEGENLLPGSYEVLQLEKEEILAPHTHFCSICGKGFKRDANLRMHMRGHGDEYKTAAALAKPSKDHNSEPMLIKRYSCPFVGCKRNKEHKKFQPLKTILCVKNHYKRSHCDKSYTCSRCNSKKFSVIADLKTHEKHCRRDKWICSCGTTFSRKDKLFGHVSLFQGHTPALPLEEIKASRASDQGQSSESMTSMGNTGFNFGGSSGDDIDALDVKVLDNVFSPLNFDSYNFGGLNEFPRPAFEVSESSFSFVPSSSSNDVRKSGGNSNFN